MRLSLFLTLSLAFLAACGADGPPVAPSASPSAPSGISISGEGKFGIGYSE